MSFVSRVTIERQSFLSSDFDSYIVTLFVPLHEVKLSSKVIIHLKVTGFRRARIRVRVHSASPIKRNAIF